MSRGMNKSGRVAAERRGHEGEWLASVWLRLKGYQILARRLRTPVGEIDLIARRRRTIAFVEVKARPDLDAAFASVSLTAQQRIARAASYWLARNGAHQSHETRFDLVAILPRRLPVHVREAWRPDFAAGRL